MHTLLTLSVSIDNLFHNVTSVYHFGKYLVVTGNTVGVTTHSIYEIRKKEHCFLFRLLFSGLLDVKYFPSFLETIDFIQYTCHQKIRSSKKNRNNYHWVIKLFCLNLRWVDSGQEHSNIRERKYITQKWLHSWRPCKQPLDTVASFHGDKYQYIYVFL